MRKGAFGREQGSFEDPPYLQRDAEFKIKEQLTNQQLTTLLTDIQKKYWRFDAAEKASLVQRDPLHLPWPDMLRLNHLCCLEILETKGGKSYLQDPDAYPRDLEAGSVSDLRLGLDLAFWPEMIKKLSSAASPYRPRLALVWQTGPLPGIQREPDVQGLFTNESMTHFGSFEVIKADENGMPVKIGFIGLDELRHVMFAGKGLFRVAKLFYDDGRADEMVWMPLLYGVSWGCPAEFDRDGSFTRLVDHRSLEMAGEDVNIGIGIGHQDFLVVAGPWEKGMSLVGLGSLAEIEVGLDIDDPKFEIKCRARGLDPDEARRLARSGKT